MQMTGNTILITGGGSGIGLALAQAFKQLGNQVIIAGRNPDKLQAASEQGFATQVVDMCEYKSIQTLAKETLKAFPALNVVIHNAGIMKNENLLKGPSPKIVDETIATNLLGPMRLTEALLPHFLKLKSAVIMTVTSGLAYLPLAMTPSYSASKAAIRSYTQSLRYQLRDTKVEVIELAPPYVKTHLMGDRQAQDPNAMPLDEFVTEVMQILSTDPRIKEVMVKRVEPLRHSAEGGVVKYNTTFEQFNDAMMKARIAEF
jgi:uncharacterized oxidoreductase